MDQSTLQELPKLTLEIEVPKETELAQEDNAEKTLGTPPHYWRQINQIS